MSQLLLMSIVAHDETTLYIESMRFYIIQVYNSSSRVIFSSHFQKYIVAQACSQDWFTKYKCIFVSFCRVFCPSLFLLLLCFVVVVFAGEVGKVQKRKGDLLDLTSCKLCNQSVAKNAPFFIWRHIIIMQLMLLSLYNNNNKPGI